MRNLEVLVSRSIVVAGETADVGDLVKTVVVNASFSARILRSSVIDNAKYTCWRSYCWFWLLLGRPNMRVVITLAWGVMD